jgi:predicted neuraminidase
MLLAHNSSAHTRALLDLSSSTDGLQWQLLRPLAHGQEGDEYSYPAMAWADGALWLSYTDHRKHIAWQRLRPVGGTP